MEGGRLLGQGTYGCAFTPPLLCKSKGTKHNPVGKVTLSKEANHEIEISNLLRKLPLVRNYFLLPDPESCDLKPLSEQKDKEIKDCEAISQLGEEKLEWTQTRQLFLPYGGKNPIGNMILASNIHPKFFPFFDFMKHVLEAGSMLLLSGVCHFDLHPNNFLKDQYNVVRILDFGQSFDVRHITQDIIDSRWKVLFFGNESDAPNPMVTNAEAPEITIMNSMRNGLLLDESIEKVVKGKEIFRDMEKVLGMTRGTSQAELQKFFTQSISAKTKDWLQFWKLYWTGYDAWAIGSLLLILLKYQLTWAEFVQGDWQNRRSFVLLALKGLLHPNPHKRLDCMEALFLFDPNNTWIQKFGKSWLGKRQALRQKQKN